MASLASASMVPQSIFTGVVGRPRQPYRLPGLPPPRPRRQRRRPRRWFWRRASAAHHFCLVETVHGKGGSDAPSPVADDRGRTQGKGNYAASKALSLNARPRKARGPVFVARRGHHHEWRRFAGKKPPKVPLPVKRTARLPPCFTGSTAIRSSSRSFSARRACAGLRASSALVPARRSASATLEVGGMG